MTLRAKNNGFVAYSSDVLKSRECNKHNKHWMPKIYSMMIFTLICLFNVLPVFAQEIKVPMDLTSWTYHGAKFKCDLASEIPSFGKIYFHARPGNRITFFVDHFNGSINSVGGFLSAETPPWSEHPFEQPISIGSGQSRTQVRFYENIDNLLTHIALGDWIRISLAGERASEDRSALIPTTQIQSSLNKFNQCRARLPAMTFAEARDTVLHFSVGQRVASSQQKKRLKALADYIHFDTEVSKVLVDGHTDNVGSSLANLQIARVRADDIASVLADFGITRQQIEVRAHGDRYPLMSNKTAQGRAKNRRVTIRLIRSNEDSKMKKEEVR